MSDRHDRAPRVLIVGSGFAGIGMAIALRRRGIHDIVILERAGTLGGTWRDNRYPGCACDVESVLYSFSFAPNPDWSRTFSPQPEIEAYLQHVAARAGVLPLLRFHEEVTAADWDAGAGRWRVTSTSGHWTAEQLIVATGALSDPVLPSIPGLADFAGPTIHTAAWDATVPLEGRRVAVIGTGASAIQLIPAIQPRVAQLIVAQRTPAWVMPRWDRATPAWQRALYRRVPIAQSIARLLQYLAHETLFVPFRHAGARRIAEWVIGWHLRHQVRDPALRAQLTPHYGIGCKRLLLSDDYYPAMTQPNVSLVTEPIARIRPDGFETADGEVHAADVLVLATGFRPTDPPLAHVIRGRTGQTLAEAWHGSPAAYLGTTVTGFPNLFLLNGPGTGLGHSSVLMMFEAQFTHVLGVLTEFHRRGAHTVEPTAEAQAEYVRWLDAAHADTVWSRGGCRSWYLDATGRNAALWPHGVGRFRRMTRRVRPDAYAWDTG